MAVKTAQLALVPVTRPTRVRTETSSLFDLSLRPSFWEADHRVLMIPSSTRDGPTGKTTGKDF